ncbi:nuclear transport factor 2 family protein [Streptomyces sp. NBC_01280]|uniref:nuclear transport factor 2 family protein n=1 Tax=Streptomyces sp. NBC_01280 TaxID=2903810 RepID=UPI002E302960|nr:nuclear transport factor 2 family protein [Streptomyces sp. NBC_01280]
MMATREVVEKFVGLLAAGDPDAVVKVFADDIDWYVPGSPSLPWTGQHSNASDVADYLRTLAANIVPERNVDEVEALLVDGDHAVMLGRFTRVAKSTGRTFVMPIAMHFQVAGDKIDRSSIGGFGIRFIIRLFGFGGGGVGVRMYLYEDTLKVSEAYAD